MQGQLFFYSEKLDNSEFKIMQTKIFSFKWIHHTLLCQVVCNCLRKDIAFLLTTKKNKV